MFGNIKVGNYYNEQLEAIKNKDKYKALSNKEKTELENIVRNKSNQSYPVCKITNDDLERQEALAYVNQLLNRGGSNNTKTQQPVHIDAAYKEQIYAAMTPEQRNQAERQEAINYVANLMNSRRN